MTGFGIARFLHIPKGFGVSDPIFDLIFDLIKFFLRNRVIRGALSLTVSYFHQRPSRSSLLGLTMTAVITWDDYTKSIVKSAARKVFSLCCARKFYSPEPILYTFVILNISVLSGLVRVPALYLEM